ncbi:zinc finger domain-containing protein [Podila minutissima]|uniref:Zinc finger domain-containing protein n=1 Tax=Podila minutissima TaxID=64525 RepID=A0A9P5SIV1_9FUNG|nr:zinc finger domain-containing protein [Podila minutissima]
MSNNPLNNNMCSKCFKELGKKNGTHQDAKASSHPEPSASNTSALPPTSQDATVTATSTKEPTATTTTAAASETCAATTTPPPPVSSTTSTPPTVTATPTPMPSTTTTKTTTTTTTLAPVRPTITPPSSSNVSTPVDSRPNTPASMVSDTPDLAPGERAVQTNKGRCFLCRAKIPLAKQQINKCRCEYVFCDSHKAASKHDCDFDFAKMGKDLLTKNNPRLNEKPRGGRSFTRIQE